MLLINDYYPMTMFIKNYSFLASRSASNTPAKPRTPGGDRFIPSRMSTNFDMSHFKVNQKCVPSVLMLKLKFLILSYR